MRPALGSLAAGGTLGILIPPSINLLVYGSLANASVGQLFAAGLIPGLLLAFCFSAYIFVAHRHAGAEASDLIDMPFREKLALGRHLIPPFVIFAVVMGSIYGGLATPTESAAIGVVISMVFVALNGRMSVDFLIECSIQAAKTSGMVIIVLVCALHPAYATWFNVLQVRPEEASGPLVWAGRRVLGLLGFISTGASSSTMSLWHPMRVAGASARHMLIAAAAARLGVPSGELGTGDGFVRHEASGRSLSYAELAREAALLAPPRDPVLRPASEWRLVGKSQPRVDVPAKVRGEPVFGMDVVMPGMLHATIRHAPVFGAQVARIVNEAEVRTQPGVIDVTIVNERQVAIVADSWWRAEQAAWLLDVEWTSTADETASSTDLSRSLRAALEVAAPYENLNEGGAATVIDANTASIIEAFYEVPFVAHACMEPINATVIVREDGSAEGWVPSQGPVNIRVGIGTGAGWAGVEPTSITCNVMMNGGAFGRRSDQDVVAQAAFLAARHRVRITPEAGSTKDENTRFVAIHPHLIEQGFLAFVRKNGNGPLFYDPKLRRNGSEANPQYKKIGERIGNWVRELGIDDPDLQPNHAWRHRFKTVARRAKMDVRRPPPHTGAEGKSGSGGPRGAGKLDPRIPRIS